MRVEDLHIEIRRLLALFSLEVKGASAASNTDISDEADMLLLELFRETFDLPNLRSLNADQANFPGLDLGDDVAGRAFQITAEKDLEKILKTLRTTISHNLQSKYPKIQVYVTTERQTRYKQATINATIGDALTFEATKDILDFKDLLRLYKTFEIDRLRKIADILRKYLIPLAPEYSAEAAQAMERDAAIRFQEAIQRAPFPEISPPGPYRSLAEEMLSLKSEAIPSSLRRRILLYASRYAALHKDAQEATRYYDEGVKQAGTELSDPVLALLREVQGDSDGALQLLRDRGEAEAVSTMIGILARAKGDAAALSWISSENIDLGILKTNGFIALAQVYIRARGIEDARCLLNGVSASLLEAAPYLLLLRGVVRLVSVLPKPDQMTGLGAIPLSVISANPIPDSDEVSQRLDGAVEDLQQAEAAAKRLGLGQTVETANWYQTWASLMHPQKSQSARCRISRIGTG